MAHTYGRLREEGELEYEGNLVKSYLLECHSADGPEDVLRMLSDAVVGGEGVFEGDVSVEETDEEGFYYARLGTGQGPAEFHFDGTDHRFLLAHTLDVSTSTDAAIHRLVVATDVFDAAWFPVQLLEHLTTLGHFRGMGLDFDRRDFEDGNFRTRSRPAYLKAQVWTDEGSEVLEAFRAAFRSATTLTKVSIRYQLETQDEFCIDDVKFNGKVTARGTSYMAHRALLNCIRERYRQKVEETEAKFSIEIARVGRAGAEITGEPLIILFDPPLDDLEGFCDVVFSGGAPFRLCGLRAPVASHAVDVAAMDLHAGVPIDFEIMPDFMRVYVPRGGCGNTLLRLYSNLQRALDSTVRAEANDGTVAFEF